MKSMTKCLSAVKLGIAMAMFASGLAFGAASVDVVMTIQDLTVDRMSGQESPILSVAGSAKVLDRMIFKNSGNGEINFTIKVTSTTGNWQLVKTVPQANEYRLSAVFHQWDAKPAVDEFQSNDILTDAEQTSSDTVFFNDNDTHETNGVKGTNIKAGEERNLFVKFEAPASGTGSAKSHLSVSAIAVP